MRGLLHKSLAQIRTGPKVEFAKAWLIFSSDYIVQRTFEKCDFSTLFKTASQERIKKEVGIHTIAALY
jgi:hypothetical protein